MGLGSHHLLSDCGKMKFFLFFLLLLLLFDSPQASSLPRIRKTRGLNTTLQTHFNGTYQRRNPCTNAEIETSSYVASHEFHHHTKEDNWSDYTHKCSAIISSFLQAIGNLVRFNNKQNGIFNFHINTSISQRQDGQHGPGKACNDMPTIIIEATDCQITPRTHENVGHVEKSEGCVCPNAGNAAHGGQKLAKITSKSPIIQPDEKNVQGNANKCPQAEETLEKGEDMYTTTDTSLATIDPFVPFFESPPDETLTTEDSSLAVPNDYPQYPQTHEPELDIFEPSTTPLPDTTAIPELTPGYEKVPTSYKPSQPLEKQPKAFESFNEGSNFNPPTRNPNVPYYTTQPSVLGFGTTSQSTVSVSNVEQINQNQYPPALVNEQQPPVVYSEQLSNDILNGQVPDTPLGESTPNSPPPQVPNLLPPTEPKFEGNRQVGPLGPPALEGAKSPLTSVIPNEFALPTAFQPAGELSLANTPSGTPMPNPFPLQQTDGATTTQYQPPTFRPDMRRFPEIAVTIPPQVQRFSPSVRQSFGEDGKSRTFHISMSYPTPPTPINDAVVPLTPITDMKPNFENNFRTDKQQITDTSPITVPPIESVAPPGKLPTPNIGGQVPSLGTGLSRDSNQFLSNMAPGLQPPFPNPNLSFLTPESQRKLPPPEQPPIVLPPDSINPQQRIPNSDSLTTSPIVTPVLPSIPDNADFIPQNKPFQQKTALPPPPQQNTGLQPSPDSQLSFPVQPAPNTFIQPESGEVPPPAERPLGQIYPPQQPSPVNAVPFQPVPTQPLPTQRPPVDYTGQPIIQPGPDAFQKIGPVVVTPPHYPPPNPSVVTQTTEVVSQINYPISIRNPDPTASGSFPGSNVGNQLNELATYNKPVVNSNDFQPKTESSFMESSDSNLDYTTQTPFYDSIPIVNKNEPESLLGLIPKIQDLPVQRPIASPTGLGNTPATLPPFKPVADNVTAGQLYTEKPNPDFGAPPTVPQFFNPPGMGFQGPLPSTPRPGLPFISPVQTPDNVPPAMSQPNSDQLITNGPSLDNNPAVTVQSQTPSYPNQNGGVGQSLPGFPRQISDQTTALQPGEFRSGPPNVGPIPSPPVDVVPSNLENRPPSDSQPNAAPVLTDSEEFSRETIPQTGGNLLDKQQPFVNRGAIFPPGFNTPATFNTKPYIPSESPAYPTQIVSEEFSAQPFTTPMPSPPLQADRPQEILQPDLAPSPPSGPPEFQSAPFPDGNQPVPQESFNGRFFPPPGQLGNHPFKAAPSYPENAIPNKEFNPQFLRNENQPYFASELEPRIIESQNPVQPPQNFLTRINEEQIPPVSMNQPPSDLSRIPESPVPFLTPEVASPQEPRPSTLSDTGMSPKREFLTNEMDKLKFDADQPAIAGQPELQNLNQLPAIVPPQFTSQSYGGAGTAKTDHPQPYQPQPSPPQPQSISPAQIPIQTTPTTMPPFDQIVDALRPPPQYLQENAADFPPVLVPQPQPQPPIDNLTEIPGDNKADIATLSQPQTLLPSDIKPVPFAPQPPPQTTYTDTTIQDSVSTKIVDTQPGFENVNNLSSVPSQNFDATMPVNYPSQDRPRPPYLMTDNLRPDDLTSQTSNTLPAGVNPAGMMMNSNEPPYLSTDMPPNEPLETALIDTASPQPQTATAAKYDEEIITGRQSSPALNPQPQATLKYPEQLSEDNIKGELLDSVASASPVPQLPLGLPPNQQSDFPMPQLPPQPIPEFSDVNKYQPALPVQPQFMRQNEMNAQFDAGVRAQEQNVGEIQSPNTPPQMFPAPQVNAPENPAFNYEQLPTKNFEGGLIDNRTITEEIVRTPPQRGQTLPGINYNPMSSNQLPPNFYQRAPQALGYPNLPPNYGPYQQFIPSYRYPSLPQNFNSNTRQIQTTSFGRPAPPFEPQMQPRGQGPPPVFPNANVREIVRDSLVSQDQAFQSPMQQPPQTPLETFRNTNTREIISGTVVSPAPVLEPRMQQIPQIPPFANTNVQESVNETPATPPPYFEPQAQQPPQDPESQPFFNKNTQEIVTETIVTPPSGLQPPLQTPPQAPVPSFPNTNVQETVTETVVTPPPYSQLPVQQPPRAQLPRPISTDIQDVVTDTFVNSPSGFQTPAPQPPQGPSPSQRFFNTTTQETVTDTLVSSSSAFQPPIRQPPLGLPVPPFSNTNLEESVTETVVTTPALFEPPLLQPSQVSPPSFIGANTRPTVSDGIVNPTPTFESTPQLPQGPPPPFSDTNVEETVTESLVTPPPVFGPPTQQYPQGPVPLFPNTTLQETVTETFVTPLPFFQPPLQQRPQGPPSQPFLNTNTQESVTETFVVPNPDFQTPMQLPPQGPPPSAFSNTRTQETVTETIVTPPPFFEPPDQQPPQPFTTSNTRQTLTDIAVSPIPEQLPQGPVPYFSKTNVEEIVTDSLVTPPPVFGPTMPQAPIKPQSEQPPFPGINTEKIQTDTLVSPPAGFQPPMQQSFLGPPVLSSSNTNAQERVIETLVTPPPLFEPPRGQFPPPTSTDIQELVTDSFVNPPSGFQSPLTQPPQGPPPQPYFNKITEEIITETSVGSNAGFRLPKQQPLQGLPTQSLPNRNAQEIVTETASSLPTFFEPPKRQPPQFQQAPLIDTNTKEIVTDNLISPPASFQPPIMQRPPGSPSPLSKTSTEEIVTESSVSPAPITESPMIQPTPAPVPPFSTVPTREIFSDSLVRQDGAFESRVQQPPQIQLPSPTSTNMQEVVTDTFIGSPPGFQSPLAQTPQGPPLQQLSPGASLQQPAQGLPPQPFLNTNTQETITETLVSPPSEIQPQIPLVPPFSNTNKQETVKETIVTPPPYLEQPAQQPLQAQGPPQTSTNIQEVLTNTFISPPSDFPLPVSQPSQDPSTLSFLNTNTQESVTETFVGQNPAFQPPVQLPPQGPPPSAFSNTKTQETVTETLVTPPSGFQPPVQQSPQGAVPPFPNMQETVTEAVVTPAPFFEPPVQKPPQAPLAPFTDINTREVVTDTLVSPTPLFRPPPQQTSQVPVVPFSNGKTQEVVHETFVSPSPGLQSPVQQPPQGPLIQQPPQGPPTQAFPNTGTQEIVTDTLAAPSPVFAPPVRPIPQVQQPLTSTNTQEIVTDTVFSPTSDFQTSLQQPALTTANTREIETDSLVSPLLDVSAGSFNSVGQTQTQAFEIVSPDEQNLYPGNKVTKLVEETITTDLPLGVTYSPIQDQLAFAETLLNSNVPVIESNSVVTTPSPEVEVGLNPSSDQIPFYDDKKVLEEQYSENVPPPSFNGNLPIRPEVQPIQGQSGVETRPPFADQVPSIRQSKETLTSYDEVVPPNMNRQTDRRPFDDRSGYGPQPPLASQAVMGPPMGYSQNVPYGFPPQHLPSFTPIAEQQHSNPLLQTLEHSHLTFPLHEPSEPPTSSPDPRGPSALPLIQGSFTPSDPKNEIRGASAPPTNWDFVNSQSAQPSAGVGTTREVMISSQPDSRVLVSDQNDPSNGPGEDYVSCCERCRKGQTPLSCPFDPIYKGNMTAPSYYILITKLPVGEDEEEQFKVEKVYLGDGTPLNCTVNAGQTFPTSSYMPIPHRADGTVKLPTKSDFA